MNRLLDIQEAINDLQSIDNHLLLQYNEWDDVADDVVKKLKSVHNHCLSSHRSSLLTPPPSSHSNSSTSSVHSDSSSIFSEPSQAYGQASQAFDRQIYSRCVRIVEEAQQQGPLEMAMISLAHHSYMAMVDGSEDVEDGAKFAQWWNQFLESIEPTKDGAEKAEVADYRLLSLERLFELDTGNRRRTGEKILEVVVEGYRHCSKHYRRFHQKPLRRLEKMAEWLAELRDICGDGSTFQDASLLFDQSVTSSINDRQKYEIETTTRRSRPITADAEYVLCNEILISLCASLKKEDETYEQSPGRLSISDLMDKIFPIKEFTKEISIQVNEISEPSTPRDDIVIRL